MLSEVENGDVAGVIVFDALFSALTFAFNSRNSLGAVHTDSLVAML